MHFSSIGNPYIKTIAVPHINFTKIKGTCNLNSTQCYFNEKVFKIVNRTSNLVFNLGHINSVKHLVVQLLTITEFLWSTKVSLAQWHAQ